MPKLILSSKKKKSMTLTPKSKIEIKSKARVPYKKARYTA